MKPRLATQQFQNSSLHSWVIVDDDNNGVLLAEGRGSFLTKREAYEHAQKVLGTPLTLWEDENHDT